MKKQWDQEREQFQGEKAVLQDVANRLNDQVRQAKDEATKISQTEKAGQKIRSDVQAVSGILRLY